MSEDAVPKFALSVRQPWAWAIIHGGKRLENRGPIAVRGMRAKLPRGRICIHASLGMTREEYERALKTFRNAGLKSWPRPDELVRGAIIGTVEFIDVINKSTSPWFFGPKALVLQNPEPWDAPIVAGGQLSFFEWEASAAHCVMHEVKAAEPKPWMKAYPGTYHWLNKQPDGIKPAQPTTPSLFEENA